MSRWSISAAMGGSQPRVMRASGRVRMIRSTGAVRLPSAGSSGVAGRSSTSSGLVEGLHRAVRAFGCVAEDELPDPDRAASCRAVPEF